MLGMFQSSEEFEVEWKIITKKILLLSAHRTVEEGLPTRKSWQTLGPRFRPRFGITWKIWKLQIIILPHKENRSLKNHSLCLYQEKTVNWENSIKQPYEAIAPNKYSYYKNTNYSPIFWIPRFIDIPTSLPC